MEDQLVVYLRAARLEQYYYKWHERRMKDGDKVGSKREKENISHACKTVDRDRERSEENARRRRRQWEREGERVGGREAGKEREVARGGEREKRTRRTESD